MSPNQASGVGRGGGRWDVVVVGSGPAGSLAALQLARDGARVALVDKARFPRDKACGDLVGPRGVGRLKALGLEPPGVLAVGDMDVVGPSGRRVRLPARPGVTYPGTAWALPRRELDTYLRVAALDAGATDVRARVQGVVRSVAGPAPRASTGTRRARVVGVRLDDGTELEAGCVVGADGATSVVAVSAGLLDAGRTLWGFALRTYFDAEVTTPTIVFWDGASRRGFPGYGWAFPGPDGRANVGLGIGTGADRRRGSRVARELPAFLEHLTSLGILAPSTGATPALGGWLRMGMAGTVPAEENVLLVGDAAGLVNPLQGEGISEAFESATAAASCILDDPLSPAAGYLAWLRAGPARFQGPAASLHAGAVGHPGLIPTLGRALTWDPLGKRIASGWGTYWNDLLAGSAAGTGRGLAAGFDRVARALTVWSPSRRALSATLDPRRRRPGSGGTEADCGSGREGGAAHPSSPKLIGERSSG